MRKTERYSELLDLAELVISGEVSDTSLRRLNDLLFDDDEAQTFYLEYIQLHTALKSEAVPNLEIVRRREIIDEVVIRTVDSSENSNYDRINASKRYSSPKIKYFYQILIGLTLIFSSIYYISSSRKNELSIGEVKRGEFIAERFANGSDTYLKPDTYKSISPTIVALDSGIVLSIGADTSVKFFNASELKLIHGSIEVYPAENRNLQVYSDGFEINTFGGSLALEVGDDNAFVKSSSEVKFSPATWKPKHFWKFDEIEGNALDSVGSAVGMIGKGVKRVKGIVGKGALYFDNSADARVDVGSGGGTAPATGTFSVIKGVTIEALIIPSYTGQGPTNGRFGEIDEIFRKDQSDKEHRILLSFQNDRGKSTLRPEGNFQESLSFGLYIVGQGYHELKLPLDGKSGRPTLQDLKNGQFHHIAATYSVETGVKAIYIDGEMLARFQYPAGSKMLSGGAGEANIGNSPNIIDKPSEAYSGVIDEVAFYDFALTPYTIKAHYQNVENGLTYYGSHSSEKGFPEKIYIPLPISQWIEIDNSTGQLIVENISKKKYF